MTNTKNWGIINYSQSVVLPAGLADLLWNISVPWAGLNVHWFHHHCTSEFPHMFMVLHCKKAQEKHCNILSFIPSGNWRKDCLLSLSGCPPSMTSCCDYNALSFVIIHICNYWFSSQMHTMSVLDLITSPRTPIHVFKALYILFYSTRLQDYQVSKTREILLLRY